mmetsp:Transcript_27882/g.46234  ORF Transcript_27882/g.46234 Transcript_27882/m.46234 type:complete len:128 (-) Transcript_27882:51-434(-)
MLSESDKSKRRKRRKGVLSKGMHQDFGSFFTFGFYSTSCMAIFVMLYSVMLLALVPLLKDQYAATTTLEESLVDVAPKAVEALEAASALRSRWRQLRQGSGVTDEKLLDETIREFAARKDFLRHVMH